MDFEKNPSLTVGNYLLDRLHALGIEHIFGVPGDYVLRFNKIIEEHPQIQFINTTREDTAGFAADAYARLRGLGVACITYGVGISLANALAQAYNESSPLVVISGSVGIEEYKKNITRHHLINTTTSSQGDCTQLEIFKHLTIDQGIISSPHTAVEIIARILKNCMQYQKPVYIEIPRDQVDQPLPLHSPSPLFSNPSYDLEPLKKALKETQNILTHSHHPLIWAGHEILRFGLSQELLQFAERYQIPIVSSLLGKTVIDENHPLFKGVYQGIMSEKVVSEAVNASDCLLMAGILLSDLDTGIFTAKIDQEARIAANQDLLTIGQHQYKVHLSQYIKGLNTLSLPRKFDDFISSKQTRLPKPIESKTEASTTMKNVFECLQKHISPEHIIVSDVGDGLFAGANLVLSYNSFICNSYFACLGFGLPGAIGAQLAVPQRRVIAIIGDGGFQMNAMELSTAVRYHLDPIVILLNNHGYGTERILLEGNYNDLLNWNYTLIPKVLGGGKGIRVETELAFEKALQQALAQQGEFTLIEVEIEKLDFSPNLQRLGELVAKFIKS